MNAPGPSAETTQVIGLFPELLGVGGVQEAGRLTAAAVGSIAGRRGWSTRFFSLNDPLGEHRLAVAGQSISFRGFGRAKVRFVLSGLRQARSIPSGVTGIILAAHPNLGPPALWLRRRSPRTKTIVMSHGIEVWKPLPIFRRRALARADIVLGPSSDTAEKLIDVQGLRPDKVRKLAWPMNPAFLELADAPERLSLPTAFPRGRVILTVGRWAASEQYKGVDELIRALAQFQGEFADVQLVAVGGGDDLPRLKGIVADLGVAGNVHFLVNASRAEIAACYSRAEIFALPSTGEGFGLVFLEAMAFSKPVLGVSCGGTSDVVQDGENGLLVPPRDSKMLVAALGRLLRDAPLRERLGRQGAEIVRKRYTFAAFEDGLADVFREFDS